MMTTITLIPIFSYVISEEVDNLFLLFQKDWRKVMEVLEQATVTSPYGDRDDEFHRGVDLISKTGNRNVMANSKGRIVKVINQYPDSEIINPTTDSTTQKWGGNRVWIEHGDGYQSRYNHLKYNSITVKEGDIVAEGQVIALEGESGYATGVHLDYEVQKDGNYIDPTAYGLGKQKLPDYVVENSNIQYVNLPPTYNGESITSWRVYPLDKAPQYGKDFDNAIGKLNPSLFDGVSYALKGYTKWNTPIIETRDFGTVHLAPAGIATITSTPQFAIYKKS